MAPAAAIASSAAVINRSSVRYPAPILKLNDDCLMMVIEAVIAQDWEQKQAHAAGLISTTQYGACVTWRGDLDYSDLDFLGDGPYMLIAFSMTNKRIRELAHPYIFRCVTLDLDTHLGTSFASGLGLRDLPLMSSQGLTVEEPVIIAPHGLTHTRSLCIKTSFPNLQESQSLPPRLFRLSIYKLLEIPKQLRRLRIHLQRELIVGMSMAALIRTTQSLPLVEELIVFEGYGFFIRLCPNVKVLRSSAVYGALHTHEYHYRLHLSVSELRKFVKEAASLQKLTSLHLDAPWTREIVSAIRKHLPNLEELRLTGEGLSEPRKRKLAGFVQRFPKLHTVGFGSILDMTRGEIIAQELMGIDDPVVDEEDCRRELAAEVLYSSHEAIHCVEILAGPDMHSDYVKTYVKDLEGGERAVIVEGRRQKYQATDMDWHWHPHTVK